MKRAEVEYTTGRLASFTRRKIVDVSDEAKVGDRWFVHSRMRDTGVVRLFEGKIIGFVPHLAEPGVPRLAPPGVTQPAMPGVEEHEDETSKSVVHENFKSNS